MDNYLIEYYIPKLNQYQINKLNWFITSSEIEAGIKSLSTEKQSKSTWTQDKNLINVNTPQIIYRI